MQQLSNPAERSRLSAGLPPVLRILSRWDLPLRQQAALLHVSPRLIRTVVQGSPVPTLTAHQLLCMSLVVGIYQALHRLYDDSPADGWIHQANARAPFYGRTPLSYLMTDGLRGLWTTRHLLDAECSRQFVVSPQARALAASLPQPEINFDEEPGQA